MSQRVCHALVRVAMSSWGTDTIAYLVVVNNIHRSLDHNWIQRTFNVAQTVDDINGAKPKIYVRAQICLYIHTYIHTHTKARLHTYTHKHTRTNTPTYLYLPTYTYLPTYLPTNLPTYIITYTHTYMHACMHACVPACMRACMHTYAYVYKNMCITVYT